MEFNSLTDVLAEDLADLYSAEQQLLAGLPRLAAAAHSYPLRDALEAHVEETRVHVQRLDEIFADMGIRFTPSKTCKAMEGLIAEGDDIAGSGGDPAALDAALIGAAQRIEHYEIALYGTARALAGELGLKAVSSLLDQTLDEEARADKTLTKLAAGGMMSSGINRIAAERPHPAEEADESAEQEAALEEARTTD